MKTTLRLLAVLSVSASVISANAAAYDPSAYEGFGYTPGTGITIATALNGGTGWNGFGDGSANTASWGPVIPNNASGNGITVGAGSLVYPGLATSGERASLTVSSGSIAIGRAFAQTVDSGSLYFSFLMQKTVDTARTLNVSFFSTTNGTGPVTERFAIGQIGGGVNDSTGNFAILISNSGVDNGLKLAGTPISLGLNNTHLVVGKIDFNVAGTGDLLTLYIDPNALGGEPGSSYMTFTTDFQVLMGFRMFAGNSAAPFTPAAGGDVDELRFGTTWGDVVVVPEPSSFAMLLCGGAMVFGYRRNRRAK